MKKEDVVRFQSCVGFEFSYPVTLRGLQGEQVIRGSLEGLPKVFVEADFSVCELLYSPSRIRFGLLSLCHEVRTVLPVSGL